MEHPPPPVWAPVPGTYRVLSVHRPFTVRPLYEAALKGSLGLLATHLGTPANGDVGRQGTP